MMALTRSVMSRNTLFHHEVGCPLQTSPSGQQRLSRPEQAGDGDDQVDHDDVIRLVVMMVIRLVTMVMMIRS